ncbi:PspC domain-containing protein [Aeromicrobium sp. CTD01-1L150]|uniref:ATP-binding protein n=1 Tax=Aeromicrobium sp. CTD01-1L150 TaxID=3341830 RepID=UPI0035BFCA72
MSEIRRAYRPAEHRLVGGVATGLAEHLGVPVLWVRVAFVVATWINGAGVLAYLALWRLLPLRTPEQGPGLDAATRRGARPGGRPGVVEIVQTVAMLALGVGVLVLLAVTGLGPSGNILFPLLIAVVGVALVWRQIDDATWGSWLRETRGWAFAARVVGGVVLVGTAGLYLLTMERGFGALRDLGAALGIAIIGLLLILGPWIISLVTDLGTERRERIRSQERADVAAHLHDSVLQTLALLQKNSADPATVATLARRQERELRAWLYGDEADHGDSLAAALRSAADEVEQAHRVPVELVLVGDVALDDDLVALVRAAREAMVNAAKHAGVDRIDVYAEATGGSAGPGAATSRGGRAEVFVRDRGVGFDPATIADDRMGVRGSIVERVERHGGDATVLSEPGDGTEVRLSMPVRQAATHDHRPQEAPR